MVIAFLRSFGLACLLAGSVAAPALAAPYQLTIAKETVHITGAPLEKVTVNGSIPGPVLHFTEGEEAVIHVTNRMEEDTSVHWHGLLLPGLMDGAPGFNGFKAIQPGETFTYRFKLRQAGTYWYHAHSLGQEQEGLYGAIVVAPKTKPPTAPARDYVVLLSDFSQETSQQILGNLKMDSAYYNKAQRTVGDFLHDAQSKGFSAAWRDASDWGKMRMSPTDLADVSGYAFLVNGKTIHQNWTGIAKPGERVKLRLINAAAMSIMDVRIPGLKLTVVAADGQDVEPVTVDELRIAPAETYDIMVTLPDAKAYSIVAEPIDRSGFAIGTLAPREGMRGEMPAPRPRALLSMFDMNMEHMMHEMPDMDMSSESATVSGWAKAGTPPGMKALSYADLRARGIQRETGKPTRELSLRLGGNMERYIWTMDGKKFEDAQPITLAYHERVRLTFINETMMAHPVHLHGLFMQLENGQPAGKRPNKHTVMVPPGQSVSVQLTANEPGHWPFHCHLLYHMLSGMMTSVIIAKPGEVVQSPPSQAIATSHEGHHHHAH